MNQAQPQQQFVRTPIEPPAHVKYAHTHHRGALTFEQIDQLVMAINSAYVQSKQNNSYLAHHQARAEMNRIFGYLNWDEEVEEMKFAYEEIITDNTDPRWPKERDKVTPKKSSTGAYYLSGYEGVVRVTIRDLWGMPLATYREYHFEENAIQPQRGEARSLAMTSVASYALRRALINMGDRFGLGLYNRGSQAPHGQYTQQLFPGQLFNWVDAGSQQVVQVEPQVTHENIQAEQALGDDVVPSWSPDQDDQQQAPQPVQQPVQQQPVQQQQQQQQQALPPVPQQQFQQPPVEQQQQQQQTYQQPGPTPQGNGTVADLQTAAQYQADARQEYRQAQPVPQQQMQQIQPQYPGQPGLDPNLLAQMQQAFKVDDNQGQQ